jgi:DDE_Tnp_1-associated
MGPFTPFLILLSEIEDPRRAEGKLYRLPHVMLFAILAMVAGANSYRGIHSFIDVHLAQLRQFFGLKWRRAPAYTSIRVILQQLDMASVEQVFRRHAGILHEKSSQQAQRHIAIDGKALRHSFDHFHDRKAAHILSAFASDAALVLAHLDCDEKSNEIPAVQALLRELGLEQALLTVDAMHCQKNIRAGSRGRRAPDRPDQGQPAHLASVRRKAVPDQNPRRSAHNQGQETPIA